MIERGRHPGLGASGAGIMKQSREAHGHASLPVADISNPDVAAVFAAYPPPLRNKLMFLCRLVLETARSEGIDGLEETLKWGEPSHRRKKLWMLGV